MSSTVRGRALIIGISSYAYVRPLPAAVRHDALDVAATLLDPDGCAYRSGSVTLLLDEDATLTRLRAVFTELRDTMEPDESFILYFSGHGHRAPAEGDAEKGFLVLQDSRTEHPETTAMEDGELVSHLQSLPSLRKVVFLDACHAGAVGTFKSGSSSEPLGISDSTIGRLGSGRGTVLLTSSRANELSIIPQGWRNSLFTDSLLRALRGEAKDRGDGTMGVFEVFQFVAEDVPRHCAEQHPVLKTDGLEGNFPIAMRRSRETQAAPAPKAGRAQHAVVLAGLYPQGPLHSHVWSRAGGDVSRLDLSGHGAAQWYAAVSLLERGGGNITLRQLFDEVSREFPLNPDVAAILVALGRNQGR
ncbi:hypothetical protein ASG47_07030 [Devosia sp. Leaf420]|uniref:caspase family protein n=1 Tax=Devosia sp. Leaf420 TaxID=1736374 RepID=UPI0007141463|nr:caspase family protein [Devosia sp. Leaf420]KQT48122.1 hypothetical protein ASG47_07030 [Devosia sp. Leaf420]